METYNPAMDWTRLREENRRICTWPGIVGIREEPPAPVSGIERFVSAVVFHGVRRFAEPRNDLFSRYLSLFLEEFHLWHRRMEWNALLWIICRAAEKTNSVFRRQRRSWKNNVRRRRRTVRQPDGKACVAGIHGSRAFHIRYF